MRLDEAKIFRGTKPIAHKISPIIISAMHSRVDNSRFEYGMVKSASTTLIYGLTSSDDG